MHPDTAPIWNGVATSSSPFQSLSRGDEDIAAPKPLSQGAVSGCTPGGGELEDFRFKILPFVFDSDGDTDPDTDACGEGS